jgi:hypothetical protein
LPAEDDEEEDRPLELLGPIGVGLRPSGKLRRMTRELAGYVSSLAGAIGMLALLAVFVFWGASNSSDALPYFAVPGGLFAVSAVLGYRALGVRPHR